MATTEFVFGPPPPSTFEVEVTDEQLTFFAEHGYVPIDRLTTDEELEWLTEVFDVVMEGGASFVFEPGRDLAETGPLKIAQTIHPEIQYPELLQTTYCRNARRVAAALLARPEGELGTWGYMVRMPPRTGRAVPWHQDEAYWEPELDYHAVGAWLSLHPTTATRGALRFVPGSHRGGIVDHDEIGSPGQGLLVAEGVDEDAAVTCEMPAGGATFHHHRTIVTVPPNRSTADVQAFILEVQPPPTRQRTARRWPWTDHRRQETGQWDDPLVYVADGRIVPVP